MTEATTVDIDFPGLFRALAGADSYPFGAASPRPLARDRRRADRREPDFGASSMNQDFADILTRVEDPR